MSLCQQHQIETHFSTVSVRSPTPAHSQSYRIMGIITIWFSQNTTYNCFIRQEMWWGRSLITGRCGKLWRETMWHNTSFCRAALIITRWILSRKIETSLCLPWRSCARSLAVRPMMWSRSNSGCWRLCRWPLFLLNAKSRPTPPEKAVWAWIIMWLNLALLTKSRNSPRGML